VGITGPPGAGKSSIVNHLIQIWRAKKLRVAVLAVDPSSPFSGGALLGDRVRMLQHSADEGVFVRSVGSRGGFGGLNAAAGALVRVFELAGFDVVIVETVGVGQTELEIMNLADATAVVLVPESGDVVQTLKAGILEIADVFVVNKTDRPGADLIATELEQLSEGETRKIPVLKTSALKPSGVEALAQTLELIARKNQSDNQRQRQKAQGEVRHLLLADFDSRVKKRLKSIKAQDPFQAYLGLRQKP
jgi:LAO/AO transport system kinase